MQKKIKKEEKHYVVIRLGKARPNTVHREGCGILKRSKNIHVWNRDPTKENKYLSSWYEKCQYCFKPDFSHKMNSDMSSKTKMTKKKEKIRKYKFGDKVMVGKKKGVVVEVYNGLFKGCYRVAVKGGFKKLGLLSTDYSEESLKRGWKK